VRPRKDCFTSPQENGSKPVNSGLGQGRKRARPTQGGPRKKKPRPRRLTPRTEGQGKEERERCFARGRSSCAWAKGGGKEGPSLSGREEGAAATVLGPMGTEILRSKRVAIFFPQGEKGLKEKGGKVLPQAFPVAGEVLRCVWGGGIGGGYLRRRRKGGSDFAQ